MVFALVQIFQACGTFATPLFLFLDEPTGSFSTTIEAVRWVDNVVQFSREKLSFALSLVLLVKAAKYEKWQEDSDLGVGRRGQLLG